MKILTERDVTAITRLKRDVAAVTRSSTAMSTLSEARRDVEIITATTAVNSVMQPEYR